jgi:hypothetical protein
MHELKSKEIAGVTSECTEGTLDLATTHEGIRKDVAEGSRDLGNARNILLAPPNHGVFLSPGGGGSGLSFFAACFWRTALLTPREAFVLGCRHGSR